MILERTFPDVKPNALRISAKQLSEIEELWYNADHKGRVIPGVVSELRDRTREINDHCHLSRP